MKEEKIITLARKLKALADKGVDGEKENAETMLLNLMEKHGITIEEIETEKTDSFFFTVDAKYRKLFVQICGNISKSIKVYGEYNLKVQRQFKTLGCKPGNFSIESTFAQYLEVEAKFEFYKKAYDAELEIFYSAFIQSNHLYVDSDSNEEKEYSAEEIARLRKILAMSTFIDKAKYLKQLQK